MLLCEAETGPRDSRFEADDRGSLASLAPLASLASLAPSLLALPVVSAALSA
jgi:hypothetical protein